MLSDRDYMRNNNNGGGGQGLHSDNKTNSVSAVAVIIVLNILVFFLKNSNPSIINKYALISPAVLQAGQYYRMVTCMFLHAGFGHILFNMWGLYLFGTMLERKIGTKNFFMMYFISGIAGSALWIFFNPEYNVPCIGASGSLFGVIIASAMFFPNTQFMLLIPPVPMKLKTMAVVYLLIELFLFEFASGNQTFFKNIAHIVHLGGAIGGYLYIKILFKNEIEWDIIPFKKRGKLFSVPNSPPAGWSVNNSNVSQDQLDKLLDKISISGINSLTEEELAMLRNAREQMNK